MCSAEQHHAPRQIASFYRIMKTRWSLSAERGTLYPKYLGKINQHKKLQPVMFNHLQHLKKF